MMQIFIYKYITTMERNKLLICIILIVILLLAIIAIQQYNINLLYNSLINYQLILDNQILNNISQNIPKIS